VTGRPACAWAPAAPAATNLVTAIADAYMDSCPLIAITGQVSQAMIGRGAFQENRHYRCDAAHRETIRI